MSEVQRFESVAISKSGTGRFVWYEDYVSLKLRADALAAQRDEGLAREAELKKELV